MLYIDEETLDIKKVDFTTIDNLKTMINELKNKNFCIKLDTNLWSVSSEGAKGIVMQIPYIDVKTEYTIGETEPITKYPTFRANKEGSIKTKTRFILPKAFLVIFNDDIYVAIHGKDNIFKKLPFGNIFTSGKICMGNDFKPKANTNIKTLKAAWEHINNSPWQYDLLEQEDKDFCKAFLQIPIDATTSTLLVDHVLNIPKDISDSIVKNILLEVMQNEKQN